MSSYSHDTSFLGDLSEATQEYIDQRLHSQITQKLPIPLKMLMVGSVVKKSALAYKVRLDTAEITPLMQTFDMNDGLDGGKMDTLDSAVFTLRHTQLPIELSLDEELGSEKGDASTVLENLAKLRGEKALRGARLGLWRMIMGGALDSTAALASSDKRATNKAFQSVVQALTHDLQYGHITRTISTSTNTFWQGGSISGAYNDIATARVASISTVRSMVDAVDALWDSGSDGALFVGPPLFRALQSQVEAGIHSHSRPGEMVKYGHESFMIGDTEVVKDRFMTNAYRTGADTMAILLNAKNARLWFHPENYFRVTPFADQAAIEGGLPKKLARCYVSGNFFLTVPGSSVYNTNWSAA